jgi:hypothetical protein
MNYNHCPSTSSLALLGTKSVQSEKHTVYIDISAKIEDWTKPSFIAMANGHSRALLVRPDVKVAALNMLQIQGRDKPQFALMAILTYIAIKTDLQHIRGIVLDRDYSGDVAKRTITRRLVELIRRDIPRFKASNIKIDNIEGSKADRLAREVFIGEKQVDGEITLAEIIEAM